MLAPFLLAAAAWAAHPAPTCRDGRPPVFVGNPFQPLRCETATASKPARPDPLPDVRDRAAADASGFSGSWRGLVTAGGQRFEVLLDLKASRRRLRASWTARDYHTHVKNELTADARRPFFGRGPMSGSVRHAASGRKRSARAWLGAAPPQEGRPGAFTRELVVVLDGRPEVHRVLLAPEGDRLRFIYSTVAADGTSRVTGELTRQKK